jgi:hypothetical protein
MVTVTNLGGSDDTGAPTALILPGAGYTLQAPLLHWSTLALTQAGWSVWGVDWHDDVDGDALGEPHRFVEDAVEIALAVMDRPPRLVLAKSLGTFALPHFARLPVHGAWLTPILTDDDVASALRGASSAHLAIGGTADPAWRPDRVEGTRAELVTLHSADHGLELEDAGWRESLDAQTSVVERVVAHAAVAR